MRSFFIKSLVGCGLLVLGLNANAQGYGGYRGDGGYNNRGYDRDDYERGRAGNNYGREPLDQVRADLDRAAGGMGYLTRGEMRRLNHAREEIAEFQEKWNRGRFDRHELDDVIGGVQHVINSNRLEFQDRDILLNDLARLREIRERSGNRDGYYNQRGYGDQRGYRGYDQYGDRR